MADWSLNTGAREFGTTRNTLKDRLQAAGHTIDGEGEHKRFTTKEIHEALAIGGDIKAARYRREVAEAALAELKLAERRRDLVPVAEVVEFIGRLLQPFRARLLAAPAVLGTAANPGDPVHGKAAVDRWVDSVLPLLRDEILSAWAARGVMDDEEEDEDEQRDDED